MVSIVYVSSATNPFTKSELHELLEKCRTNNAELGVTGMLLYKDGNFMQMLEGEEETVVSLQRKIERDSRHRGMITLFKEAIIQRSFEGWSMGFRDLDAPGSSEGFSEILNCAFTGREFQENPSSAQKLLLSFKRTMA